jgi:hypothetical protein
MKPAEILKQVVDITPGYPFRGRIEEDTTADTCAIQMKDVTGDFKVNWETVVHATPEGNRPPDWLEPGDIIFIAKGNNNFAIYLDQIPQKAVCSPHFFHLRPKRSDVIQEYVAWLINQIPGQDYFRRTREGSGTLSVRRVILEQMPLPVPSVDIQEKIIKLDQVLRKEKGIFLDLLQNRQLMIDSLAHKIYSNI